MSLFFCCSLDRCDRLDLQPDLWQYELLDHEQRVRRQGLTFKELRVEFAAQAMEDRQIVLVAQQGAQGDDVLHLTPSCPPRRAPKYGHRGLGASGRRVAF